MCSRVVRENFNASAQQRALPTSGINRERSTYNNQFEQSLTATCTFDEKEGGRACADTSLYAIVEASWRQRQQRRMQTSQWARLAHDQTVTTMTPPSWHATLDGQWHANRFAELETYFPKLAGDNERCSSIQQTECACPCCVLCTPSRVAKRPLAASLPATPVGSQALLDRLVSVGSERP